MLRNRNLTYAFLLTACLVGWLWVMLNRASMVAPETTVCLFKHTTGLPCPSCGSTRAVVSLANGDLLQSLRWNPVGLLIAAVMIVAPGWIVYDLTTSRSTMMNFIHRLELFLKRRWVAIPAILVMLVNWAWNISKGL